MLNFVYKGLLTTGINENIIYVGLLIAFIISIPTAFLINKKYRNKFPMRKSFAWGYYLSILYILSSVFATSLCLIYASIISAILCCGFIFLGILLYKRKRWAWVIYTIISLNPILFVINSIYIARRWKEMGNTPIADDTRSTSVEKFSWWLNKSRFFRAWIFLSVTWCLLVYLFVLIFEPFGAWYEIEDSDYLKMYFVMAIPCVGGILKFAYDKVVDVKPENS